ncbi:MAG: hypothetical protein BRC40_17190 [Cyanobacteria bacterium QH_8_48_120]|jgi:hypothetical protein|nr:MAG: hypothetical protein BRC34_09720 [Cyanobacteria bacterium QH_1_48_107]PSO59904.1 MAG: hypothetical protein BRC35_02890 [Cyanobacteria bacterium QH_10_48_56]PSO62485.1 MAG: hypothetical protein BRC38_15800 [Cyanobacteria bacterium QH_6_48_35]PSO67657.1 MAG: hypothetical protein BRC39_01215 [Cyanobacteria bacterium QH_7_48_89]PSO68378.1 MAG: hypothetical protein BRC42_13895 [Cyanobacteria bacterium QS_1_48_34]PSO68506.1 MAG: hypothetical protein BRC40_17190 [Cyanobacteria bacterium QH_8_
MDQIQEQITVLDQKIERLYQIVEQLSHQIAESRLEQQDNPVRGSEQASIVAQHQQDFDRESLDSAMKHKDILSDRSDSKSNANYDSEVSSEIQIRRLHAQLTAAYNRIATLEEQLLACKIHS